MRPLELDFLRARRPSRVVQAVLLAIAAAFAADVAWQHMQTRIEVESLRMRLAQRPAPERQGLLKVAAQPVSEEEFGFARDTIRRLSMPWDTLFVALETARIDSVALLSIEPDPAARTVLLQAEAKDYLAALSYVANLREQPALRSVHLVRHETRQNEPRRPVQFSVSASWDGRR